MDLLDTLQQATGTTPQQSSGPGAFDPKKSYGTPSNMLDNLTNQESSGGKNLVNKTTGAMGPYQFLPSTVAALRNQGVKFDPFDPKESRAAADWYIQTLKQEHGGTYEGALKAYGGFVTKDPSQYIDHVKNGVPGFSSAPAPTIPGQNSSGQQPSSYSGPTSDLLSTLQGATQGPPSNQPDQIERRYGNAQAAQPQAETSALSHFGHAAAGLADTVLSGPGALAQQGDYAIRRALQQTSEQASQGAANDFGGSVHPVGNLFGVTNTPGYQGEASQRAMGAVGNVVQKGSAAVANATGLPQQDVENMAGSLSMLAPGAVKGIIKKVGPIVGQAALETAAEDSNIRPQVPTPQVGPVMQERGFGATSVGSAAATANPYPVLTGEDASRGPFPQVKLSKISKDVTLHEQGVRAGVVNEIMGENAGSARTGVITGNENTLRDEYAAAKTPNQTPATQAIRTQIANEQQALSDYAEKRIQATGASQTLLTNDERGRVINDAIYGDENSLKSYLHDAKRSIYDQARATSGDNPIQTQHVDTLLSDPQFRAGVKLGNNETTLSGAQDLIDLARTTGFKDPVTGEMYAPNSVAAWDAVRKSLNSQWSPSNANLLRQLNGAIDRDIAATGGQEMYKLGDRIHQVEKTLLDSKGIGSVLGEYDANGIKTGASLESIPAKLNSMPQDQWQHIRDTLDELSRGQIRGAPEGMPAVPKEVQQAAAAARAEMDGALARAVHEAGASKAGVWNQNAVNKVLNSSVGQKILRNFSPDEIQNFHTLNYGGQIMPGVHSYEGAGNQISRLSKPGFVERYAPHSGATTGAAVGAHIPIPGASFAGAALGERIGQKISGSIGGRRERSNLQNITNEMHQNALLGEQSPGVPLNSLLKKGKP
ncbi:lytic transglycosylase domain-containing protein [Ralstonia insidiosa]|uniref:lytic transglycosylase domain-containing protein n=1 Tax=Ralstonia insidiosa TaxID=190721 RepID=UPI000CEE3243|nr:lytic transglycosylase domain-containing protein [Ralstonia insidiosa]